MQSTDPEIWLPIPGFEGHYEVSDHGRIRSLDRRGLDGRRLVGRVMRQTMSAAGYRHVNLVRDGAHYTQLVHRAVLLAFVGPCPKGMETRHLDNDPANNARTNLEWSTHSTNNRDRVAAGMHHNAAKTECSRGHAFVPANTVVSSARPGKRQCKACQRAWTDAKRRDVPLTQELADEWFARITEGTIA